MAKPVVAVVGRPNVGKSTLFNKLIGTRLSIVDDTPGVTRDRIYGDCEWLTHKFLLVDTGGIEPDSSDIILSQGMYAVIYPHDVHRPCCFLDQPQRVKKIVIKVSIDTLEK